MRHSCDYELGLTPGWLDLGWHCDGEGVGRRGRDAKAPHPLELSIFLDFGGDRLWFPEIKNLYLYERVVRSLNKLHKPLP